MVLSKFHDLEYNEKDFGLDSFWAGDTTATANNPSISDYLFVDGVHNSSEQKYLNCLFVCSGTGRVCRVSMIRECISGIVRAIFDDVVFLSCSRSKSTSTKDWKICQKSKFK